MTSNTGFPPGLDKLPAELLNKIMPDLLAADHPIVIKDEYEGAPVLQTSLKLKHAYLAMYLASNRFTITRGCDLLEWIRNMGGPHLVNNVTKLAVQARGYHYRPRLVHGGAPHVVDMGPITLHLTLHQGPATPGLSSSYITINTPTGTPELLQIQPEENSLSTAQSLTTTRLRGRANFGFVEMLRIAQQMVNGSARWETNISIHGHVIVAPTIDEVELRSDLSKATRPAENGLQDFVREKTTARLNAARYRARAKARRRKRDW